MQFHHSHSKKKNHFGFNSVATFHKKWIDALNLFSYVFRSITRISLTSSSFSCKCLIICCPKKPLPPLRNDRIKRKKKSNKSYEIEIAMNRLSIIHLYLLPVINTISPSLLAIISCEKIRKFQIKIYSIMEKKTFFFYSSKRDENRKIWKYDRE